MDNIVIVGSSGHAKGVIDIVQRERRFRIVGLVDDFRPVGEQTLGYSILGRKDDLRLLRELHALKCVVVAVGDNVARQKLVEYIGERCPGLGFVSAIHQSASIGIGATIGEGSIVMAGATISPSARIGRHCIVNTRASFDHDSVLADFASLAPGVVTGGNCHVGAFSAICIGAVLVHGVAIGEHSVVGAGSVVTRSIGSFVVAYGSPARAVRTRRAGDKYL